MLFGINSPTGVGLSINAGIVTGGGFLRAYPEKGEYSGELQLSIEGFLSLTAIGLITTRPTFSMLIIITTEFSPPFQLGYGFTLIGVGGLLGLNRTVRLDPLRDSVRNGRINSVLFPTNVIANAPRIISDLESFFPAREGYFLVGPMAKIGWGTPTLISLSLGVIIQLPDPKIAILGVLKITLPTEEIGLLKLQVNFLGTIDPAEKMITFDASLFDSKLLRVMTLTGDMAVRLKWGIQPDFILSAGGFHPEYEPVTRMPAMQRLSIKILDEEYARIRVESYFAVTSNTVQFGAKAHCYFGLDGYSISGELGFDALLQFSPFMLKASASARFILDAGLFGETSVFVHAKIKGPAPWRVEATGVVEAFGQEWKAEKTIEWGDNRNEVLPRIALKGKFEQEIAKQEVWHTKMPFGREQLVTISNHPADPTDPSSASMLRIHPFGSLVIKQKMLPLDFPLDKFGNQEISDVKKVTIDSVQIGSNTAQLSNLRDYFAVAQFKNLRDSDKLSRPSFEPFQCGVTVRFSHNGADFMMGNAVRRELVYEQIYLDKEPVRKSDPAAFTDFRTMLKGMASKQSKQSRQYKDRLRTPRTSPVLPDSRVFYTIAGAENNTPLFADRNFATRAEANEEIMNLLSKNEALTGQVVLIQQT